MDQNGPKESNRTKNLRLNMAALFHRGRHGLVFDLTRVTSKECQEALLPTSKNSTAD